MQKIEYIYFNFFQIYIWNTKIIVPEITVDESILKMIYNTNIIKYV